MRVRGQRGGGRGKGAQRLREQVAEGIQALCNVAVEARKRSLQRRRLSLRSPSLRRRALRAPLESRRIRG